jgi:hypothetical protein
VGRQEVFGAIDPTASPVLPLATEADLEAEPGGKLRGQYVLPCLAPAHAADQLMRSLPPPPPATATTTTHTYTHKCAYVRTRCSYEDDVRHVRTEEQALAATLVAPLPRPPSVPLAAGPEGLVPSSGNFQRKVQPWEMFLENELDATRTAVQVRPAPVRLRTWVTLTPGAGGTHRRGHAAR